MTIKQYDTIHDGLKTLDKHMEAQNAHIAQLEAELAEARKDSERLDKVRRVLAAYQGSALGCNPQILFAAVSDAARGTK